MKFCAVAALLFVSLFATSMALPARLGYYQQPSFYYQSRAAPQRLMYMQYVQQPSSSKTSSRLTNAAAAFVSGDTVATGTYIKDDASAEEQQIVEESILDNTGANGAESVAEAYPADDPQDDGGLDAADAADTAEAEAEVSEEPATPELPEDNQVLEDEILPAEEGPVEEDPAETKREISDETAAEAEPEQAVALAEPEAENDDDEAVDDDDDEVAPVAPNNARRQAATAPAPLPAGTFFPIDFGGVQGGAIAIANSFSTGVSGSAKSQAIAYGRPQPTRAKGNAVRRH